MSAAVDRLERGREAAVRHAWREAFELLGEADRSEPLAPPDLESLGEAAWWLGNLGASIDTEERAFRGYLEAGDEVAAARLALSLSTNSAMRGDPSMYKGWLRRAQRLLEGKPEAREHGLLERKLAASALPAEPETALERGRRCEEIGTRLGDPTVQALGIHEQARALITMGKVEEGLALMEEAVVAAISGDLEPRPTGVIYCNAIEVCRDLTDYSRAGEWTDAAKRWCERMAVSGFPGICRVRKAEITRLRGGWAEAEREARQAVEELRDYYVDIAAAGLYEIGEIRLRVGDLESAEDAFRQANEMGEDPQPGMAILRLRQGKPEAALKALRRTLDDRGADRLHRARLLPALVEIAIAAGELETARKGADEMEEITETYTSTALRAAAAGARGRVLLAEGEAVEAASTLRVASRLWREVDAPYEAAEARALLGLAYRAADDEETARLELEAALRAFDEIGAAPDAARVADALGGERPAAREAKRIQRTFMFTDIVGSTGLIEAIGDGAWSDLQRWHDETLRAAFAAHGGEEVDHAGDGFFVSFPDAGSAIECAVTVQRRLAEHRRTQGFAPRVRIGVHAAEATKKPGGFGGRGVHAAARIGAMAEGEEILASTSSIPERCRFPVEGRRTVDLRGIAEGVEVAQIDWRP